MTGGWWGLVAAIVLGLVINESGELSPWLAQKLADAFPRSEAEDDGVMRRHTLGPCRPMMPQIPQRQVATAGCLHGL